MLSVIICIPGILTHAWVLVGGSTPRQILRTLSSLCSTKTGEFCPRASSEKLYCEKVADDNNDMKCERAKIDWSRIVIFLIDERYVPHDHEESNQNLIRQTLIIESRIFLEIMLLHFHTSTFFFPLL